MPADRRRRSPVWAIAGATAALVGSYLAVTSGRAAQVDHRATQVTARPLGPAADRAISVATDVGSIYGLAGVSGALLVTGRRRLARDVAASGLIAWSAAQGAKPLLPRERPYEAAGAARLVAPPAGTSWPSGHASVAVAMASTLAPQLRPGARAAVVAAASAVGVSRMYVGVHHLSDVVAGWGIGALSAAGWRLVSGHR